MEPLESTLKPFRFKDPRQEWIYQKLLLLVGPGPAAFYQDACRLMTEGLPFETTTHLVAHLLREIESALRDVLESVVEHTERLKKKVGSGEEKHNAEAREAATTLVHSLGARGYLEFRDLLEGGS